MTSVIVDIPINIVDSSDKDLNEATIDFSTQNIWECFDDFEKKNNNEIFQSDDNLSSDSELDNIYGCTHCKSYSLIYKDGTYICNSCGLEQLKRLSNELEYRNYGDNDHKSSNPERVGLPVNYMMPESSMGTLIAQRTYDNNSIKRMVQYNSWNQMPYKERSSYKTCCKISNNGKMSGLPTIIIERAKELYNIIRDINISRGDNKEGLIAACIFFACIDEDVPRSNKEIAEICKIDLKDMTRGIKNFRENWRLAEKKGVKLKTEPSNPIDFIERYVSNLPVSSNIKDISQFIAIKSIFMSLVDDNTAPSIAAGAIFLACVVTNQSISKKQVADACKTSEVTISKCFKKLNDYREKLLPRDIISKYIKK